MRKLWLFSFWILLASCETEITDFKTQNLSSAIVAYGEMNSISGPYTVRLAYTSGYSPFDVTQFQGQVISGADVQIVDGSGASVPLKETQKGVYQTSQNFKGIVRKKYKLKIKTPDGKEIESTLDELKSPVDLSEFSFAFRNAEKVENMYFDLTAKIADNKISEDYYFIKRQDFIQFLTTCPEPPPPPAPVPSCDCKCWQAPQNTQPILLTDFLVNGTNIPLGLSRVEYRDFTDYVVELQVYNVSKAAHQFWKRQEEQRVIGGGLFDKVPSQIIGNLSCINDPSQQVLGFFMVGGVKKQRLLVDRYTNVPVEAFKKLTYYVEFNDIRYKNYALWDCRKASWVPYNIGLLLPYSP